MSTLAVIVGLVEIVCGIYALARDTRLGAGVGLIVLGIWILINALT